MNKNILLIDLTCPDFELIFSACVCLEAMLEFCGSGALLNFRQKGLIVIFVIE